jgi:hypothetical protein
LFVETVVGVVEVLLKLFTIVNNEMQHDLMAIIGYGTVGQIASAGKSSWPVHHHHDALPNFSGRKGHGSLVAVSSWVLSNWSNHSRTVSAQEPELFCSKLANTVLPSKSLSNSADLDDRVESQVMQQSSKFKFSCKDSSSSKKGRVLQQHWKNFKA